MIEMKCPNCGAQLHPAPGADSVKCPFCGAEYRLEQNEQRRSKAGMQTVCDPEGVPTVNVYVPEGWTAQAGVLAGNHSYMMPITPMLVLTCADGRIMFTGPRAYGSATGMIQDGAYDARNCVEYAHYRNAGQTADMRMNEAARTVGCTNIQLVQQSPLSQELQANLNAQVQQLQVSNPGVRPEAEGGEYLYSFTIDNEEGRFLCTSESVIMHSAASQMGGFFGKLAGMAAPETWYALFDCTLFCGIDKYEAYRKIFYQTISTVSLTPQFEQSVARCHQMRNQQLMNNSINASRAAAQTSQNLSRIHNDISDGIMSRYENNAASQDRISEMRHESMMDVNTFQGNDGRNVEFDTRADHVYQHTQDSDFLVGKEGAPLDGMSNFDELKRKQ